MAFCRAIAYGYHQPMLTSKYHVSTDSGLAILFYCGILFISMDLSDLSNLIDMSDWPATWQMRS